MTRTYLDDDHHVPTRAEAAAIRDHLYHGIGTRRVRVRRTGEVDYYGSVFPDDNRVPDCWLVGGGAEDILKEIAAHKARLAILRDSAQPSRYEQR